MTKKEKQSIDFIVCDLSENVADIAGYNVSISRLARAYEKSQKLTKEEGETFEKACRQIEETINSIDKTISWLRCYGTGDVG